MTHKVTIEVDQDLCIGNAMCRANAPKTFIEGANGLSVVGDAGGDDLDAILEAAASCPVNAIRVADADTKEELELPW